MAKRKKGRDLKRWRSGSPEPQQGKLRIIGGQFGGRQIAYSGDPVTRPMKDNTREAVFNLVGGWVAGKYAFDLFAGTGAIGLEAISRGATGATLIERHIPTAKIIQDNVSTLGVAAQVTLETSDTFFWTRQYFKESIGSPKPVEPWVVFCCPPYDLFVTATDQILAMLESFMDTAPKGSIFVVESDERFDPQLLPHADQWNVRIYSPARISIWRERFIDDEDTP